MKYRYPPNANNLLECIARDNINNKSCEVIEQFETDDNFYRAAAARFTEAVLTVATGIAIYKVKPRRQSEESEENKDLFP